MLNSYPSIYNLGHAAITDLLRGPVIVEEKVDGSQFSFGVINGELQCRSKGANLNIIAPEGMFVKGVNTAKELADRLTPGWTYRGEYLKSPKHNTLAYARTPVKHVILFDINTGLEQYLSPSEKLAEAMRLGLECVPAIYHGVVEDVGHFRDLLETTSVLGGQKIEGVVVKPANYDLFGKDKKCLFGKFVSEAFKEAHSHEWSKSNPSPNDILGFLGTKYGVEGRWMKATQHLREAGKLEGSPRDIGGLLKEIPDDVLKECEDAIKAELFKWAWPHVRRAICRGVPEWYKNKLLEQQFNKETVA
jgi:hypothetical protein